MKKILLILMCLCLIISTLTVSMVSVEAVTYGDFEYSVLDDGTIEITNYTGELTTLEIPSEINGKAVTSIGEDSFYGCESLTSVIIPNSVTFIGWSAFQDCTALTSVTIPNSVTNIGSWAFSGCKLLTSVTIPDSVTSIGICAFYNTGYYNNQSNWENNVLYIGKYLVNASCYETDEGIKLFEASGEYTIKEGTKVIADYAFEYCESLTSIIIPDSVTSIGEGAFKSCTSLTSIIIPNSVTSIGKFALGYIYDYESDYYVKVNDFIIKGYVINGYANSEAQRYANDNGFTFISLGEAPTQNTTKPTVTTTIKPTTKSVSKYSFKAPQVKAKSAKGKISLTLKKVKGTAGYQVRYKVKGKWKVKTFKIKKNATKLIKNLKKGSYKVQIRLINNSKKALSNWSKAKTIKIK